MTSEDPSIANSSPDEGPRADRRAGQRDRLVDAAEAAVAIGGLTAIRARDLARDIGCSLGAIYNLVGDLDELVLLVNQRTMAALGTHLDASRTISDDHSAQLVAWALAYARFAAANRNRWRALFDFRMRPGADLPPWFASAQQDIFLRLEERLGGLVADGDPKVQRLRARTLFSAVHGIVSLGLEGKLVAMPAHAVDAELANFVTTYVKGLGR